MRSIKLNSIKSIIYKYSPRRVAKYVLLAQALVFAVAVLLLPRLQTHYSMTQFLPKHHALLDQNIAVESEFQLTKREPLMTILDLGEKETGSWLEPERIQKLRDLSARLEQIPGVNKLIHIANVEGASQSPEGITVGKLLELTPPADWRGRVLKDKLLAPQLISADARQILLVSYIDDMSAERIAELIGAFRRELQNIFPMAQIHMGGVPAVQSEVASVLNKELGNFLLLGLLLSVITLASFFRNISSVFVPLIIMVHANVVALGWMALTGTAFTVLSTTLPVLVTMTVISMATHTMLRFASDWKQAQLRSKSPDKYVVLEQSFRVLFLPNSLTAMTTAIGFFAVSFTNVPLIHQYGQSVGLSIFIAWLSIIIMLPCLLALFPIPEARDWTNQSARWSLFITAWRKEICVAAVVIACALLWQGKNLNWETQLFDDLPAGHEARSSTEAIDKQFGGMVPLSIVIRGTEENTWNDPESLQRLARLLTVWRNDARVGSAVGLPDFMEATARLRGEGLPISRRVVAEDVFIYSFSGNNPLNQFLTPDGRATRLQIRLKDVPAGAMADMVAKAQAEAQKLFPNFTVSAGSMATTVHVLNAELSHELIFGFWQALGLISILLLFVFRSLKYTLVAMIPNLLPPILLLGALGIHGTPVKPAIALIFSIALGIAYDNTVYLLGRLKYLANQSQSSKPQIQKAWYQEANLCLFSTIALSMGFSVFLASYFSFNQAFGLYMLVSLLGGLLGDLIFLPALLALSPKFFAISFSPASPVRRPFLRLVPENQSSNQVTEENKENSMQQVIAASILVMLSLQPTQLFAADAKAMNADEILKQVGKKISSNDEVASVKMTITEANGAKKERDLEIKRKSKEPKQQIMVRMQSPADLKGTALLTVSEGKTEDQWLYLPSAKKVRRIQSSNKSSNFMDSELNYEDLGTSSDKKITSKIVRSEKLDGHDYTVIESTSKVGESSYSKVLTWVDKTNYLVSKVEYYDKAGKLLKVSQLSSYKQFDKGVWRAQKIQIQNVQTKRGTTLDLAKLAINKNLGDEEFSQSALSDED